MAWDMFWTDEGLAVIIDEGFMAENGWKLGDVLDVQLEKDRIVISKSASQPSGDAEATTPTP